MATRAVSDDYLAGMTSENFSLEGFMSTLDSRLLETSEGRRIATRLCPLTFALLYMSHHLRSEQTGGKITLSDFHLDLLRHARDWLLPLDVPRKYRDVYVAPRDCGKALALDTPLLTPEGWTTMGEVEEGDVVYDERGRETNVVGISNVHVPDRCYRVHFSDGTSIEASGDHRWITFDSSARGNLNAHSKGTGNPYPENWHEWKTHDRWGTITGGAKTRTTDNLFRTQRVGARGDANHSIPLPGAIERDEIDLPIDPYVLGYWLGNGSREGGRIWCHNDHSDHVISKFVDAGYEIGAIRENSENSVSINIIGLYPHLLKNNLIRHKHVPDDYFLGSIVQREALIAGLIDSDGYVSRSGNIEFSNTNFQIAYSLIDLLRSIGQKPSFSKKINKLYGVEKSPSIGVRFVPTKNLFTLPEKANRYQERGGKKSGTRNFHRMIVKVEEIPRAKMRCISVDSPSHLYLAGEGLIPTHNTTWLYGILPLWAAAHRHYTFVAAFSDSGSQAEQHLASFRNELENNTLLQIDHPSLCTPKRREGGVAVANNANQIYQRNEFTFIAKGIDSGALGMKVDTRRPQLIILDDIERGEGNYTPHQASQRLKTVLDTVLPMNIFARIIIVGTVTMNGSIIHQLVKKATDPSDDDPNWIEEENFSTHYNAPIITEDDGRERSVWPDRWPLDFLQSIRHTRSFKKNFENLPISEDSEYWSDEDFVYGDLHTSRVGLFIDPATTSKTKSDYTALAVVGMSPPTESFRLRRCVVRWAKAVKLPPDKLRDLVIQTLNEFPEIGVVQVEVNQGGDLWYTALHNLPVKLKVTTVSEPKEQRAARLLSQYQRNRVYHLNRLTSLENQMTSYPNSINDDLIDSVGLGVTYFLGTGKRMGRPGIVGNLQYS